MANREERAEKSERSSYGNQRSSAVSKEEQQATALQNSTSMPASVKINGGTTVKQDEPMYASVRKASDRASSKESSETGNKEMVMLHERVSRFGLLEAPKEGCFSRGDSSP